MPRLKRVALAVFAGLALAAQMPVAAEEPQAEPSFLHGFGKMIDGLVFELPKTVLEGTLAGPPVVGTVMGALGGVARAGEKTVAGFAEMSAGFNPWGTKRKH